MIRIHSPTHLLFACPIVPRRLSFTHPFTHHEVVCILERIRPNVLKKVLLPVAHGEYGKDPHEPIHCHCYDAHIARPRCAPPALILQVDVVTFRDQEKACTDAKRKPSKEDLQ